MYMRPILLPCNNPSRDPIDNVVHQNILLKNQSAILVKLNFRDMKIYIKYMSGRGKSEPLNCLL